MSNSVWNNLKGRNDKSPEENSTNDPYAGRSFKDMLRIRETSKELMRARALMNSPMRNYKDLGFKEGNLQSHY